MPKYKDDPTDYWRVSSDFSIVDNLVVAKIGLNEAIVLRTLYSLCRTKKQNDGVSWWQGKREYWLIKFPWLSLKTLQRVFAQLEKLKLIEIRIDKKTGNHYRPVREQIEHMLNDDDFRSKQYELTNDTLSGQIDLTDDTSSGQIDPMKSQNVPMKSQNDPMKSQNDLSLLSLGSHMHSQMHSPKFAASEIAATEEQLQEPVLEVLDSKTEKQKSAGALIFEAYQDAYLNRYGIEPLRNAKTNSICAQIAKQLPLEEALGVMHFFVQQNVAYYLQKSHSIQCALADLQALRTNMLKNRAMSSREAYLADKQQAQKNTVDDYLENREQLIKMFGDVFD